MGGALGGARGSSRVGRILIPAPTCLRIFCKAAGPTALPLVSNSTRGGGSHAETSKPTAASCCHDGRLAASLVAVPAAGAAELASNGRTGTAGGTAQLAQTLQVEPVMSVPTTRTGLPQLFDEPRPTGLSLSAQPHGGQPDRQPYNDRRHHHPAELRAGGGRRPRLERRLRRRPEDRQTLLPGADRTVLGARRHPA